MKITRKISKTVSGATRKVKRLGTKTMRTKPVRTVKKFAAGVGHAAKRVGRTVSRVERAMEGKPRKTFPRGLKVQSLVFDKREFTPTQARAWARQHGFRAPPSDTTPNTVRLRQSDPRYFHRNTYRMIRIAPGVQAAVALPKSRPIS